MMMTTDEYVAQIREIRIPRIIEFMDIGELSTQTTSSVPIDEPLFLADPSEVRFQRFTPFEEQVVAVRLRNMDGVGRRIKVLPSDSPYFEVIPPPRPGAKVAPGMEALYLVKFTPDAPNDYADELVCITEREKFVVPIVAIGARALLDFPDTVDFGPCTVKHTTTKTLFIRNIGDRRARFTLETSAPFSLEPANGDLAVGESLQIQALFKAETVGTFEETILLR
jgi:hydrocephalus-inducing protein